MAIDKKLLDLSFEIYRKCRLTYIVKAFIAN